MFIVISILVISLFIIYFISNIVPKKVNKKFEYMSYDNSFINNCTIENRNNRIAIYLDIRSQIFKQYEYHSYISGDATGRKINLEMYLISSNNLYKIKSYCYNYSEMENYRFLGYYYKRFIKNEEKYNLAIYIPENNVLYVTDVQI